MERVSDRDKEYMRRLGLFMAAVKADELADHRALPMNERIERGLQLARQRTPAPHPPRDEKDLGAFFRLAKQRGLYRE